MLINNRFNFYGGENGIVGLLVFWVETTNIQIATTDNEENIRLKSAYSNSIDPVFSYPKGTCFGRALLVAPNKIEVA